ncbi:segregation and condensation protein B [Bryocella elongata]|uniref:Segregation and condensation protein B n=1 Tax=Bryocella elongata TaxID=863522 RepID=A0A1H6BP55_9BACT|nr:SMC-Scp complex subunit ScpB [Bryocella elongata]SEG62460.1 segregation and condensation protein B [Bryocella elongata]
MSLKSKIEAVIYASEEPVTLVQLIGLLSEEAQAELDAIAARQSQLALDDAPPPVPAASAAHVDPSDEADDESTNAPDAEALNAEVLDAEVPEAEAQEASPETEASPEAEASPETESVAEAEVEDADSIAESDPAGDADAEEDAAEAAEVDELVAEDVEPAEATEPAVEAEGGAEAAPAPNEGEAAPEEIEPENEAEARLAAVAPLMELRQPTPEEDEISAKAWARAKERELRNYLRSLVDQLIAEYANSDRGIEIREVAGGFRFSTKPEYHDAVRGFIKSLKPPMKLSLQALETLAVIAYKQPVTAPEISEIRGVDSGGVVGSLIARKLVTTAGRKQVIGRPILYKTTKDFLVRFGLKDINELPSIEEFEKMAGELADFEPTQEEIPMDVVGDAEEADKAAIREAAENAEPMADEHEAQADGVPDAESEEPEPGVDEGSEAEEEAIDIDADEKPEEHSELPAEGAEEIAAETASEPEASFNVDADVDADIDADLKPFEHAELPAEGSDEASSEETEGKE